MNVKSLDPLFLNYGDYTLGLIVVLSISVFGIIKSYKSLTETCSSPKLNLILFGIALQIPLMGYLYIGYRTGAIHGALNYLF